MSKLALDYPELFNFSHPYTKLKKERFTTIRSVNYDKKHPEAKLNQIGYATLERIRLMLVKIVGIKDMPICDIPIDLLKADVEYENFKIATYQEFVEGLNQITRESGIPYANNRLTTVKRIYVLENLDYRTYEGDI